MNSIDALPHVNGLRPEYSGLKQVSADVYITYLFTLTKKVKTKKKQKTIMKILCVYICDACIRMAIAHRCTFITYTQRGNHATVCMQLTPLYFDSSSSTAFQMYHNERVALCSCDLKLNKIQFIRFWYFCQFNCWLKYPI